MLWPPRHAGFDPKGNRHMPKVIWKQELIIVDETQHVYLPKGAEVLCVREQRDTVCVWFTCDKDDHAGTQQHAFKLCHTGGETPESDFRYVGTALLHASYLVLHAFWRAP